MQKCAAFAAGLPSSISLSIHFAKGSFKDIKYKVIEIIIAEIIIAVGILIFINMFYHKNTWHNSGTPFFKFKTF